MGLSFKIFPAVIDESQIKEKNPKRLTEELAVRKVKNVIEIMKDQLPNWICGADTVIAVGNKIFGKPENREDAAKMLEKLSGIQHRVITSVALYNGHKNKIDCRCAVCLVNFTSLSKEEIEWYLETNEWQGVAGAYRIQGLAGCFITRIKGSVGTVVGLPLNEFYAMLRSNGYPYGANYKDS
jgi:septum formation protein